MRSVILSREAESDIDQIAAYTMETWGERQTDAYLAKLEDGFLLLAVRPHLGRSCDEIRIRLRRFEIEQHMIFYENLEDAVLIVRVLHQKMLVVPARFEP
jgi:toxin ParE1/3/4